MIPRRKINWKLESLLKQKNISVKHLALDLQALGVKISVSQIGRLVNPGPQKVSSRLLIELVKYFDCDIGDLLKAKIRDHQKRPERPANRMFVLVWKAKDRLQDSGLSYRELAEKLESVDVHYHYTVVYKNIVKLPKRIDIELLEGFLTIFNCNLEDILDVE